MNEQQAIALVQKTFQSAFDRSGYIQFLKNLLNEFDDEGARSNQGKLIPDKFQNYVERLERVGKYKADDGEVMLFIVTLKNNTSIERARTMQRNFIAHYLQMDMKDAALVAFVSKDPADWRFSFIKMEYRYDEERNKIKEEFTPAKRWSFLVGTHEASHTAQRKLVPLMADDERNPTLADLEDAFNIEKVTKEFFEKYRGLFIRTKDELDSVVNHDAKVRADFESKGIDTVNFAKKLLGQIIFLYYLQKKGWFGVGRDAAWGEGSRNFLRELFGKCQHEKKNFFNHFLEPLFYEALRVDRSHVDHYYSQFDCKIPFLNGGLFDPIGDYNWHINDILLPNELFHNTTKTKEGDEGDGILDIFDRYNFTVKEDEPFEKEVAIDPELLGKAYEKFNAIRPDNYDEFLQALKSGKKGDESKFNKQYGVYYTPREIVHYMCQQSLINYLFSEVNVTARNEAVPVGEEIASDKEQERPRNDISKEDLATLILKGEQIKEHDERVVAEGRETVTYSFQMPESIRAHAALIDEKLANIKVCDPAVGSGAFPVGMMNEIVRAREVVDLYMRPDRFPRESERKASSSAHGFESAGDSVKPVRSAYTYKRGCIENSLYGVDIDSGAVEIAKLRLWLSLVVDEDDIQHIKPLPNLDYKIVCGNSLIGVEKNLFNNHLFTELEALKPLYFNATNITQKQETKKKIDGLIDQITDGRAQFDFEIYFSEVFHEQGGFDVVIGNPPYVFARESKKKGLTETDKKYYYKNYDLAEYQVNYYPLFIEKGDRLLKTNGCLCYITPNNWLTINTNKTLRKFVLDKSDVLIVNFYEKVFETAAVDSAIVKFRKSKENQYVILYEYEQEFGFKFIKEAKSDFFTSQRDYIININASVIGNSVSDLVLKIENNSIELESVADIKVGLKAYQVGKGKPAQDIKIKEGRIFHSTRKIDKDYFKYLDGKDVSRYLMRWSGEYLKYGEHLAEPRKDFKLFSSKRILVRQIPSKPPYCIHACVIEEVALNDLNSMNIINIKETPEMILGILNSRLISFWFIHKFGKMQRDTFPQFKVNELSNFPLPKNRNLKSKEIIKLVERILAAKAKNPQADTSPLEREIDELVYQLYGLSPEEIAIIEGKG